MPKTRREIAREVDEVLKPGPGRLASKALAAPGAFRTVTLWKSYVGKGAPLNRGGNRVGYGLTKEAASAAAEHWANQAPWERFKRVTIIDRALPPSLTTEDEIAAWNIVGIPDDYLPATMLDKELESLIRSGKYATAVARKLGVR